MRRYLAAIRGQERRAIAACERASRAEERAESLAAQVRCLEDLIAEDDGPLAARPEDAFGGFVGATGLDAPEGPYPQLALPTIRWGLGDRSTLRVSVPDGHQLLLALRAKTNVPDQSLTIIAAGRELTRVDFESPGVFESRLVLLPLTPGEHEVELRYAHYRVEQGRPLAVLYTMLQIAAPPTRVVIPVHGLSIGAGRLASRALAVAHDGPVVECGAGEGAWCIAIARHLVGRGPSVPCVYGIESDEVLAAKIGGLTESEPNLAVDRAWVTDPEDEADGRGVTLDTLVQVGRVSAPMLLRVDVPGWTEKTIRGARHALERANAVLVVASPPELHAAAGLLAPVFEMADLTAIEPADLTLPASAEALFLRAGARG